MTDDDIMRLAHRHLLYPKDDVIAFARDLLAAQPVAPTIPEGYALVPVEPTPEMLRAAERAMDHGDWIGAWYWKKGYAAMLSAAPQPPASEQQAQPKRNDHAAMWNCSRKDGCLCGGDTPGVRATCDYFQAAQQEPASLPLLPAQEWLGFDPDQNPPDIFGYTANHMREYAQAAVAAQQADRTDAARYRWRREFFDAGECTLPVDVAEARTGEQLDAAIDAAMSAQQENSHD